jgi:hypothetical protein
MQERLTIKELIEILKDMPQDALIDEGDFYAHQVFYNEEDNTIWFN